MNYNIKLFVHGVPPKGQQIWGAESQNPYIDSFYGRKAVVRPQLLIEVLRTLGKDICYYTYWQNGNVLGRDGKTGSAYFALTIRMEMYYADVVNIYNLLDAAFNKYIVDRILKKTNSNYVYIVDNFDQEHNWFLDLEKELQHYLNQFSSNSDFISLTNVKPSNQSFASVNLIECDVNAIYNYIRQNGCISISPEYPTTQLTKMIEQKETECNSKVKQIEFNCSSKLKQKDDECSSKLNEIKDTVEKLNKTLNQKDDVCEQKIRDVKKQYSELDKELSRLKSELSDANDAKIRLQKDNENYKRKAADVKKLEDELKATKDKYSKQNLLIQQIKDLSVNIECKSDVKENTVELSQKQKITMADILRVINRFINIVIFICILFLMQKSCSSLTKEDVNEKFLAFVDSVIVKSTVMDDALVKKSKTSESEATLSHMIDNHYTGVVIDVSNYSESKPMSLNSEKFHKLNLDTKNAPYIQGEWISEDFIIFPDVNNEYYIVPKHSGKCKISYCVDGIEIVSRLINVEEP